MDGIVGDTAVGAGRGDGYGLFPRSGGRGVEVVVRGRGTVYGGGLDGLGNLNGWVGHFGECGLGVELRDGGGGW